MPKAYSSGLTDTQKAYAFLTDVLQVDLYAYQRQIKYAGTLTMGGIGLIDEVYGTLLNDTVFPQGGSSANLDFIVWFKDGVPYHFDVSGDREK